MNAPDNQRRELQENLFIILKDCLEHRAYEKSRRIPDGEYLEKKLKESMVFVDTHIAAQVREERRLLERLKLEFDANRCDCGEPWRPSDAATMIDERLQRLSAKDKPNE